MSEYHATPIMGLRPEEVIEAREKFGRNQVTHARRNEVVAAIKGLAKEPMVVLLLAASTIYFLSGNPGDGLFLAAAILLVAAISLYQDSRSRNALEKLKDFTRPGCRVIRDGVIQMIKSEELVVGDSLVVEEGVLVVADGLIMQANDFSVNESLLTGESLPVQKYPGGEDSFVWQGTTVAGGLAIAEVTAIGNQTRLSKIGKSLLDIAEEDTPLERQIGRFVKKMALLGLLVFAVVWGINYFRSGNVLDSLLKALALAMSILPEEIPVAFTTFMALGAWRLMKMGIVVKQMKTVETLGSATVICTDKTGTITENHMRLAKLFVFPKGEISDPAQVSTTEEKALIRLAMWASEPIPFDPMEKALHEAYAQTAVADERPHYRLSHEYPLGGTPPMMTHVFENDQGGRIISAKGAPEALIALSALTASEKAQIETAVRNLAQEGYRLLGVGEAVMSGDDFPKDQQALPFQFKGIVAFYDPPKPNIPAVLEAFYTAGIAVKIVTGDNPVTTASIAREIGFRGWNRSITGAELAALPMAELQSKVGEIQMFTRMFPEAKLKAIEALKANGEVVAMIGDGVNDGPALKAAHIGIAMGKKGTEIAKDAASIILAEDDLSKLVDAVAMGRKIYANLKKAIRYIISIHLPIILTVFVPLAAGWIYPNIFSPVHVIFLELIMGPTCSIVYENEPVEKNTMQQPPRPFSTTFFNGRELIVSLLQGLAIAAGTLFMYRYAVAKGAGETLTRTLVFTTLIAANIFLTLVNRSFHYSIFTTLRYRNPLILLVIGITVAISGALIYLPSWARFFEFEPLTLLQLLGCMATGLGCVIWYEVVKWRMRRQGGHEAVSIL